ncbi:enoyl-CoA hydratase [Xylariaceae sp. FL0594]|nr:enoyl-CoA hydratase [Xylariaceae sp. FL0594]
MRLPKLPARAAHLKLDNASRRNALSLEVLTSLREQLVRYNTPPGESKPLLLPDFSPSLIREYPEAGRDTKATDARTWNWLIDGNEWRKRRNDLPKVLVLRSEGPVFCAGHDLKEIHKQSPAEVEKTFDLCREVMALIRQSPIPVVGVIHGLATAAGAQLALTTDLPVALASARFQLPGMSIGHPCTSPSTALSRKLGNAFTYRMFALAEPVRADQLPSGAVETVPDEDALEARVSDIVGKMVNSSGQAQAIGKWTYWTQAGIQESLRDGTTDSFSAAAAWAAKAMAIQSGTEDAKEGRRAFMEKRTPTWNT